MCGTFVLNVGKEAKKCLCMYGAAYLLRDLLLRCLVLEAGEGNRDGPRKRHGLSMLLLK